MTVLAAITAATASNQTWFGADDHDGARVIVAVSDRSGGETATAEVGAGNTLSLVESRVTLPGDDTARRSVFIFEGTINPALSNPIVSSTILNGAASPVAHSRVAIIVDENDTYILSETASADSGTSSVEQQDTGTTASVAAGDLLIIAAEVARGGNPEATTWTFGDPTPPNPGGGDWDLVVQAGTGVNDRHMSMSYLSLVAAGAGTHSDTVDYAFTATRQSSALIVVWRRDTGGGGGVTGDLAGVLPVLAGAFTGNRPTVTADLAGSLGSLTAASTGHVEVQASALAGTLPGFTANIQGRGVIGIEYVRQVASAQNHLDTATLLLPLVASGNIGKYSLLVMRVAADNMGTDGAAPHLSISDPAGNSWTVLVRNQDPGVAGAGVTNYLCYTIVETVYPSAVSVTLTFKLGSEAGPNLIIPAKGGVIDEFSGVRGLAPEIGSSTTFGGGTLVQMFRSNVVAGSLLVASLSVEAPEGDPYTPDSDTLGGPWIELGDRGTSDAGAGAPNVTTIGAYKIPDTTETTQGWNIVLGVARDHAGRLINFAAIVEGEGTLARSLPALTGALTGGPVVESTFDVGLPGPITGDFTAERPFIGGILAGELPALVGEFTGQQPDAIGSDLAGELPALTASLIGQRPGASFLVAELPALEGAFTMQRRQREGGVDVRPYKRWLIDAAIPVRWPPWGGQRR